MRAVCGRQEVRLRLGQGAVGHEHHAPQPQRLPSTAAALIIIRLRQLHILHHDPPAHDITKTLKPSPKEAQNIFRHGPLAWHQLCRSHCPCSLVSSPTYALIAGHQICCRHAAGAMLSDLKKPGLHTH